MVFQEEMFSLACAPLAVLSAREFGHFSYVSSAFKRRSRRDLKRESPCDVRLKVTLVVGLLLESRAVPGEEGAAANPGSQPQLWR